MRVAKGAQNGEVGKKKVATPTLNQFGRDLTALARQEKLAPLIGRKEELRTLGQILLQERKNNPLLLGEAGVGKTCIVEGLAQKIATGNVPTALTGKRIIEISMSGLLAGTKYRGEFETRIQGVINEVTQNDDIILFIDEIHTVMEAGGEGASDAANIMKPALARGGFPCIGATTIAEYRKYIETDPAFERRFQDVWVDEPTRVEAIEILQGLRARLEKHHQIQITEEAIIAAVELSQRYLPDSFLPDKAIDLIDQACAAARLVSFSPGHQQTSYTINRDGIAAVVAKRSQIPIESLTEDEIRTFA